MWDDRLVGHLLGLYSLQTENMFIIVDVDGMKHVAFFVTVFNL